MRAPNTHRRRSHDRRFAPARDSTRWRPASSSRSRPGATTKAMSSLAKPFCSRKRSAARSSALSRQGPREQGNKAARERGPGKPRRFRHVFAGNQAIPKTAHALICIPTCWPSASPTATAALARNSSGNNGVRRFPEASGTWSGPSIRCRSRTLFSISTGWEPSLLRYLVDFYGVSSSRLQGGLPTDRLLAEWELDSPRVKAILEGRTIARQAIEEQILVPASIDQWKANETDRERALAVQLENRQKFQQAFSRGLAVLGFSRDAEGNGVFELGFPTPTESDPEAEKNEATDK